MSYKRKKCGKRILSGVLTFALTLGMVSFIPSTTQVWAADSTSKVTYGNETNAVSDSIYDILGIVNSSPEEFNPDSTEHPMSGYSPVSLSELYVGHMNSSDNGSGGFKVLENTTALNDTALNLNNMSNTLIGEAVSFSQNYENIDSISVYAQNACAVDVNADGKDEILEVILYVDHSKGDTSWIDISIYSLKDNKWVSGEKTSIALTEETSDTKDYVKFLGANNSGGYTALAVGDYDADGAVEAAVYIPTKIGDNAYIGIYDIDDKNALTEQTKINVSELSKGSNVFNYAYKDHYMPIVHIATTSIAGWDDIVVNISHPANPDTSYSEYGHGAAISIFHNDNGKMTSLYSDLSLQYGTYRMRFCSAIDGDLNGNGVGEIVVAGYKDEKWNSVKDVGQVATDKVCIQVICWNGEKNVYEHVWSQPKLVNAISELAMNDVIMEPIALTTGKLHAGDSSTQVFVEGMVFKCVGSLLKGTLEGQLVNAAHFEVDYKMTLDIKNSSFISKAYTATFSTASGGVDQIVFVAGNYVREDNEQAEYDIAWIWEENAALTGKVVNNNFVSNSNSDTNGAFITLCPINADEDAMSLKYVGKSCGWSKPKLYGVIQSMPYWNEISYASGYAGSTTYTVTYPTGIGAEGGIGNGVTIGGSAMCGAGLFSSAAKVGMGAEFSAMAQYIGNSLASNTETNTFETVVYAGNDYAVVFAVPMVSYQYKLWVPTFVADKQFIDSYKAANGGECPYNEGDVIEGHEEDFVIQQTLTPSMNCVDLHRYNKLVEKYKDDMSLVPVTSEMLSSKTIGDPTTYPKDVAGIQALGNVVKDSVYVSETASVISGSGESELSYTVGEEAAASSNYTLSYDGKINNGSAVNSSFTLIATESEYGFTFAGQGNVVNVASSPKGMSFATKLSNTPSETSVKYSYNTQMALYKINNASSVAGETIYVVGYIVTGIDEAAAAPAIPDNFGIFATTDNSIVLKWDKTARRPAQSYEIFMKKDGGEEVSLGTTADTFFIASDLEKGKKYEFAIKAYSGPEQTGEVSVMSQWVGAVAQTKAETSPQFTASPENVVVTDTTKLPTLKSEAKAGVDGAEITYQWQMLGDGNVWADIEGATDKDYQLKEAPVKDPTYYRVIATQKNGDSSQIIISKTAAVFLTEDAGRVFYNLAAKITAVTDGTGLLYENNGIYYISRDTGKLNCTIELTNADDEAAIPQGDSVNVVCVDEKGNKLVQTGVITDGKVSVVFDVTAMKDSYKIYVEYAGKTDGKNIYMPVATGDTSCHLVTAYKINYHIEGGVITSQNPIMVSCESDEIVLGSDTISGYNSSGWYWDEEFKNKVEDQKINASLLMANATESKEVDLYLNCKAIIKEEKPVEDDKPIDEEEDPTDTPGGDGSDPVTPGDANVSIKLDLSSMSPGWYAFVVIGGIIVVAGIVVDVILIKKCYDDV